MRIPDWVISASKDPSLKATVRLGRNGLTESIMDEIRVQLSARSLVKIRLNRGFAIDSQQRTEIFSMLEEQTTSILVFSRGNVAVLWRQ
ncbi:MAG: hypothetical protein CMB72_01145 [Euryarchaeota archaeon]|nr:hypothetical protein [Euryarchaeota archaeon]